MSVMSDSLMAFQPAIEEASNMMPSEKASSFINATSMVTCWSFPRGSVNRRSTNLISLFANSLSVSSTFLVLDIVLPCYSCINLQRVGARLARPDTNGLLDIHDEDLAVADATRARGAHDRFDRFVDHVVAKHDFDFH